MNRIKNILNTVVTRAIRAISSFSITEKVIFGVFFLVFFSSVYGIVWKINDSFMVEVPAHGGSLSEGVIGSPRFINPLLAVSDTDRDLVSLVYSGLMRVGPDGTLIPDLAESYTVSETGTVYTFKIRSDAKFQDGAPVTADDVLFTIQEAQNPTLKSPRLANWEGVTVAKIDDHTVTFTLNKGPYSPFIENTTLGILPKHKWNNAEPQEFVFSNFNIEPIGSGPYKVSAINRNSSGVPQSYVLKSFKDFTLGEAYLSTITLRFYDNETSLINAYKNGEVESLSSLSAANAENLTKDALKSASSIRIERFPLPRDLGVFFNQNQNKALAKKEVRQALDMAIDKQSVIDEALSGYGTELNGPIPPGLVPFETISGKNATSSQDEKIAAAQKILTDAGWKKNDQGIFVFTPKTSSKTKTASSSIELSFSIATSDTAEFKMATDIIAKNWRALGANVDVKIYDPSDLNQNVIRPRKYDALFFGEIIGRDLDFYGFWHSSQRNDPGLNIALYTNSKVDQLLTDARTAQDRAVRLEKYKAFEKEIVTDVPAVFIYAPDFIYILPKDLNGVTLDITTPEDRFAGIYNWYKEKDKVWKVVAK